MAPAKDWDDEDSSSEDDSPAPIVRKSKFDDEEDEEDVLDSWDAAEDSEVEREKAAKAAEAKKLADEEAKKNKKSKTKRIEEKIELKKRMKELESDESSEEEDEADKRARMRKMEQEADLRNAADLIGEDFSNIGISKNRTAKPITVTEGDAADPSNAIDLSSMKLFRPDTLAEFNKLKEVLFNLVAAQNSSKARYGVFAQDLVRGLLKDLPSESIKKAASTITTLSNEKLKEEKAADKGGKKTKAAKTKTTLNASRDVGRAADVGAYDHDLDDDDFM